MEKIVNKKGSLSVEAIIIIPMLIILIGGFVIVWIHLFEFDMGVLETHQEVLKGNNYEAEVRFMVSNYEVVKSYNYSAHYVKVETIQRIVRTIIYVVELYFGRIQIKK